MTADEERSRCRGRPRSSHHLVVIGAGFGGLETVHQLAGAPVRITLVDRRNHHLFQPLLYQVATASLAPSEIAWPIRHLLRKRRDVTTCARLRRGRSTKTARRVRLDDGSLVDFDTLVLATGARHAYFSHDDWEPFAPGLKTLEDATASGAAFSSPSSRRSRDGRTKRAALMTFVIVGAGPTGVELAGTIAELARDHFPRRLSQHRHAKARIVLIEAGPRALPAFRQELSDYAQAFARTLGVEVELGQAVTGCTAEGVVYGGKALAAATVIWAAGVQASPAAQWLDAPADRAGRLKVEPDLTVPGRPEIFAIGDAAIVVRP